MLYCIDLCYVSSSTKKRPSGEQGPYFHWPLHPYSLTEGLADIQYVLVDKLSQQSSYQNLI